MIQDFGIILKAQFCLLLRVYRQAKSSPIQTGELDRGLLLSTCRAYHGICCQSVASVEHDLSRSKSLNVLNANPDFAITDQQHLSTSLSTIL